MLILPHFIIISITYFSTNIQYHEPNFESLTTNESLSIQLQVSPIPFYSLTISSSHHGNETITDYIPQLHTMVYQYSTSYQHRTFLCCTFYRTNGEVYLSTNVRFCYKHSCSSAQQNLRIKSIITTTQHVFLLE